VGPSHSGFPAGTFQVILAFVGLSVSMNSMMRSFTQDRVYRKIEKDLKRLKRSLSGVQQDPAQLGTSTPTNATKEGYWLNQLPDLRYGGASWSDEMMKLFAFPSIFIGVWLILLSLYLPHLVLSLLGA
jgi:hypothetical protein